MRKMTFTVPEALAQSLMEAARREGDPASQLVTSAVERELRLLLARRLVEDWEAENGAFSEAELADISAEIAAADAEAIRAYGSD